MRAMTTAVSVLRRALLALEQWFLAPADPRAYAGLRIGYAIAAFSVTVDFWPLRHMLLGQSGLFGGAAGISVQPLNVFAWVRGDGAVTGVLAVALLATITLGLGILPRLSAAVTYLWVLSYSLTAPTALTGFDAILRVVGFVLLISPMPKTWTVFGRTNQNDEAPPVYGLRLAQWQLMLIYVCTVWMKAPDPFWRNGEAVTYFEMSMFARAPSSLMAHHERLGAVFTYGTLLTEVSVPFLLWMRKTRGLGVFLGVSLHIGIALTSKLALFTLSILPLYLAFFETGDFDRIASFFGGATAGPLGDD
jgi:hypothetical protein